MTRPLSPFAYFRSSRPRPGPRSQIATSGGVRRQLSEPPPYDLGPGLRRDERVRACGAAKPLAITALGLLASACLVGPNYQRPSAPVPPQFKEAEGWTASQPADALDKGAWWSVFDDPVLDGLERRVAISNQTIAEYLADYRQARQIVAEARSTLFPTVTANGEIQDSKSGGRGGVSTSTAGGQIVTSSGGGSITYTAALDATWAPDLWGQVRRQVESDVATAQADAAEIANARLSAQGELANDYFELRANDAQQKLLRDTIADYGKYLQVTLNQYHAGYVSQASVLTAQTQLLSAQASLTDDASARAQYEHAIALLIGVPPAELTIAPVDTLATAVPVAPAGLPSTLLERRPDIAQAERQVAAANALIGVQKAAFFPTLTLTGSTGQEGTNFGQLFNASSNYWSVGGALAETVLDFGERRAAVRAASAARDAAVANYREVVLTAFQGVEDQLAILRTLQTEIVQRQQTVEAARKTYQITLNEYRAGTVDYLNVISAAATLYTAAEQVLATQQQRLQASATLIQDLGGGWQASDLPGKGLPKLTGAS
jgi:NodT family efflux transporter outer membrane factor (OMF) lipoprotein